MQDYVDYEYLVLQAIKLKSHVIKQEFDYKGSYY